MAKFNFGKPLFGYNILRKMLTLDEMKLRKININRKRLHMDKPIKIKTKTQNVFNIRAFSFFTKEYTPKPNYDIYVKAQIVDFEKMEHKSFMGIMKSIKVANRKF
jgi:hypothetical protein